MTAAIEISAATVLTPNSSCVVRQQEEGYLIYNPHTDELHLVPAEGFCVYQICDGLRTVAEVEEFVRKVTRSEQPLEDSPVRTFLEKLLARGILEVDHDA